jgi:hypothetical protein
VLQHHRRFCFVVIASFLIAMLGFASPARALNSSCTFDMGADSDLAKKNYWDWIINGIKSCKFSNGTYPDIIRIIPAFFPAESVDRVAASVCDFSKPVAVFPHTYGGSGGFNSFSINTNYIVVCALQKIGLP